MLCSVLSLYLSVSLSLFLLYSSLFSVCVCLFVSLSLCLSLSVCLSPLSLCLFLSSSLVWNGYVLLFLAASFLSLECSTTCILYQMVCRGLVSSWRLYSKPQDGKYWDNSLRPVNLPVRWCFHAIVQLVRSKPISLPPAPISPPPPPFPTPDAEIDIDFTPAGASLTET